MKNLFIRIAERLGLILLRYSKYYYVRHIPYYEDENQLLITLQNIVAKNNGEPYFFIQIGANDGITFDPIHHLIETYKLKGICLEPIPQYFEKLQQTYRKQNQVRLINKAISTNNGTKTMYKVKASKLSKYPDWASGISSLDKNHLLESGIKANAIEGININTVSLNTLLSENDIRRIDLLIIDAEGYDFEIIKMIDFEQCAPKTLYFEHLAYSTAQHKAQFEEILTMLSGYNYLVSVGSSNAIAHRPC